MVHYLNRDDIIALCDGLCSTLEPPTHSWPAMKSMVSEHIRSFADLPEAAYVPSHKWFEFISGCVGHAVSIAQETQLRPHEARAMLQQVIGHNAPLSRQFRLDAAMERARYEPMMLSHASLDQNTKRTALLIKRWNAMRAVQQEHAPLSSEALAIVQINVERAIHEDAFANYRVGPMLQFFAEMLTQASSYDDEHELSLLESKIGPTSAIWRRFALKSARFTDSALPQPPTWPQHVFHSKLH